MFHLEFVGIVCRDERSINACECVCYLTQSERYCCESSLAVKIYVHLISTAPRTWPNGTLYFMEINILWSSFKFIRQCTKQNSNKAIMFFAVLWFSLCVSMPLYCCCFFIAGKVVRHYYGYENGKMQRCADISTLPMTNLCMHKMLFHFIIGRVQQPINIGII